MSGLHLDSSILVFFSLIAPLQGGPGNAIPSKLIICLTSFNHLNALLGLPLPPGRVLFNPVGWALVGSGGPAEFPEKLGGVSFASCYPGLNPVRTMVTFWTHGVTFLLDLIPFMSSARRPTFTFTRIHYHIVHDNNDN